jgi:hypothetical protein
MYNLNYALSTIILVIRKVFMKAKMGRPKVPKAKKRGIFIVTRVSPEESQAINGAIRRSGQNQSEWARKALLSAAGSDKSAS